MRAKKVAIFVEHYPPYLGSDRTIFELGKRLPDMGYKVHFIATQPFRYLLGRRPDNWEYKKNWETGPPHVGKDISASYLLLPKGLERLWYLSRIIALPFTLLYFLLLSIKELIRFNPDVTIAAHATPIVGVVSVVASKLLRKPVIMGCPDWMSAYAAQLSGGKMTDIEPLLLQTLEVSLIKSADSAFTITSYMKRVLSRLGIRNKQIKVIPNGVDPEKFTNDQDQDKLKKEYNLEGRTLVLYSGHIEEWAGTEIIVPLTERMAVESPESMLLLVGAGEAVENITELVYEAGTSNQFQYMGIRPFAEMPKIISAADIALCLFPNTLVSHAASPLKVFEYMGCGKAIVATSVSGTVEALTQDAGVLVKPGNTDEICSAIISLCKDPNRRRELGRRARELAVEQYSWTVLTQELSKLITKTLNEKRQILVHRIPINPSMAPYVSSVS